MKAKRIFNQIESTRFAMGINAAFRHLLRDHLRRNWQEIRPEEVGALTSTMLFSDEVQRDDVGKLTWVGRIYWNPSYQVEDEIEELREKARIFLKGAG